VSDVTVWTSKSVPVLGMVTPELKFKLGGKTLQGKRELAGAGSR
jgi:hypothetical protein